MTKPAQTARGQAIFILNQVLIDHRLMSEVIGAGALDVLDPADRARAQRLATDTLRALDRADRLLSKHLRKAPPVPVYNILRLATVELAHGGDAHGIVNEAVALAAALPRHGKLKGLVNAVLRKVTRPAQTEWNKLPVPRLPKWLRGPLIEAYSPQIIGKIEAAHFAGAPLDITPKGDAAAVAQAIGGTVLPTGTVRLQGVKGQVSTLPGFVSGDWWVQDAAAALPVKVLAPQPGEAILDMCAAPGGKTLQLAAAGAKVTALDQSETRMERVRENLKRTGLKATCVVGDALEFSGKFDAILLDAPCSATGTIRRHPDLPHAKDGSEFGALIGLQAEMIDHALSMLRPGGRLVFCTCSLIPDEGECQIDEALARHKDLSVDPKALNLQGISPEWITEEGGLRLRPDYFSDLGGLDGFYMACLRKKG